MIINTSLLKKKNIIKNKQVNMKYYLNKNIQIYLQITLKIKFL